LGNNVY